jgi:polar amino acid transport system substrate-binding protein
MKKFFICVALMLLSHHACAREFIVNAGDIPPFCHEVDGTQAGIAVDMLREVAKSTGIAFTIRFLPWKRAQIETQSNIDQLIIPLTRTPEREKDYQWIAPLISYNFVIATHGGRAPPRTIEEAKKMSLGVLRGNPMENVLPKLGFTNLKPGYTEDANAKLLLGNRIDGWVVADVVARDAYKKAGGNPADLHLGVRIGDTMWIHLAASPQFPEAERKLIADELNRMRGNGEAEKIINRHRVP